MKVYYRKLMDNGSVSSKFRLGSSETDEPTFASSLNNETIESTTTHHNSNCSRCYRLKKKCSRTYPACSNCEKAKSSCEYLEKHKRKKGAMTNIDLLNGRIEVDVPNEAEIIDESSKGEVPSKKPKVNNRHESKQGLPHFEYITMKPVEGDLPMRFVLNYFINYQHRHPFISKTAFMDSFQQLSFVNESIITLDVYLVMAIGCLIVDAENQESNFLLYFSDKIINAVLDIVHSDSFELNESSVDSLKLLILLATYATLHLNLRLCWKTIGILDRMVTQLDMFRPEANAEARQLFWCVYNLDKELNLLMDKSGNIPADDLLLCNISADKEETPSSIFDQRIALAKLQNQLENLKLRNWKQDELKSQLNEISQNLEKWRIQANRSLLKWYSSSAHLQDTIISVNLDYFYMHIEMDQISTTRSSQFTLQFLSNSFTLFLRSGSKAEESVSLKTLFWYKKFFNVVQFNLDCLAGELLDLDTTRGIKMGEIVNNLILASNLSKYVKFTSKDLQEKFLIFLQQLLDISEAITSVSDGKQKELVTKIQEATSSCKGFFM